MASGYSLNEKGETVVHGAKNLAEWKKTNPAGGRVSHGAYSRHIRKRYTDKRTTEGRQLATVMDALIDDLGGNQEISAPQRLLLDSIKSSLDCFNL